MRNREEERRGACTAAHKHAEEMPDWVKPQVRPARRPAPHRSSLCTWQGKDAKGGGVYARLIQTSLALCSFQYSQA